MCELLGMSAQTPTDICVNFKGLCQRGHKRNRDGWGIAYFEGKRARAFHESTPSVQSELANFLQGYPIKSSLVIAHIRHANRGKISLENTHPFIQSLWGRSWCFAHNGQLKGIKKEPLLNHFTPVGTTDSEHAFCWILSQMYTRFKKPPSVAVFSKFLKECCHELAKRGVFNLLFSDGQYLYAHCSNKLAWCPKVHMDSPLQDKEVSVELPHKHNRLSIIASVPLNTEDEWHKAESGDFLVFQQGHRII